ncbi:hypothetical protein FNV43_RR23246 [Rhamnella rubrinervis]|uniref:Uncharacterized protein n=1 Tax=Rhamnella rubrinervis TaxID=2594499 RepID=A0A8K0DXQ3_9ROSA|nr:hypothetical protein FNV43_RR23246 [Rhamnella rubrinervis]
MVRAPCCEKMGLKKGPWTPEEDQILINYIRQYGHSNWRALPKLAGLLRCGKSCRLRWTNYLRPDIKRGNFSREEEETIIKLHEMLGNRWSAIASRLPGRTDNEIKNVWHTHLKKRLKKNHVTHESKRQHSINTTTKHTQEANNKEEAEVAMNHNINISSRGAKSESVEYRSPASPPQCSSEISSVTTGADNNMMICDDNMCMKVDSPGNFSEIIMDENFWLEALSSAENCEVVVNEFSAMDNADDHPELQFPLSPLTYGTSNHITYNNEMDFWYNIFTGADEITPEILLPDFLPN